MEEEDTKLKNTERTIDLNAINSWTLQTAADEEAEKQEMRDLRRSTEVSSTSPTCQ